VYTFTSAVKRPRPGSQCRKINACNALKGAIYAHPQTIFLFLVLFQIKNSNHAVAVLRENEDTLIWLLAVVGAKDKNMKLPLALFPAIL
jgi:hypothetical protein